MLPQDRVQDFSKMDPQQLLRSTLSAVGGQESVSQLDELIETRQKQRSIGTKLTSNTQLLQEQIRLNERLKLQIDAMQQRKEIEQKIELCEKKKLWLEYQDLREKVIEYTNDKKEAVKLVNSHKSKVEPLEKIMEMAKRSISQLEQQKLAASRETLKIKDKVKETLESIKTQQYRIKEIESSLQEKIERHRNRQREIDEAKAKLDKLVTDKNKLVETVGDETKVKLDLDELKNPLRNTNLAIDRLKKNKGEVQYDLETNVSPQIRLYQNKIRQLQDVGEKRLAVLRESSEDAYKAVMWLRRNRDMFEEEVYEPMVLEINFTDQKFARYLENTVANRDLLAFTFTNSRDMNLFMRTVRSELKLKRVNAVCSSQGGSMQPPKSIDQLSYLGFYTYLVDTITAPDPILRYLCKQYNIHRIPIGNEHTYNNSGKVPPNITYFFTENHRFVVRVSSYSGVKSSSTIEIQPAKLMTNSMDVEKLNSFNTQLARFEQTATEHAAKLKEFDKKIALLEQDYNAFVLKRKKIMDGVEKVKTITTQIRLQQSSIRGLQSEPALDIEEERGRAKRKHKDSVLKQCRLHGELKDLVAKLHRADVSMFQMKLELSRNAIVQQESELRELKHELRNTQATLENIENLLTRAKSTAKEKLLEAKQSCNNKLPQDPSFPYKEEFEALPTTMAALMEHSGELQTRIHCMDKGDDQVIKEYEEREKTISKLKADVNNSSSVNKQMEDKMIQLREAWLPPLEELLQGIGVTFGDMFAKMGCAGEVKLDKGGSDEDYDKYGIAILVRFRDNELLQQLTRHTQSGGERALTTAIYLMSLQLRVTSPFRCVDEINQGMDPINERKMFQLLVKVTTDCDNGQYFLLTPKLLSKLDYNPKIMVHTIQNGRTIMNYKKWKLHKFLESAQNYTP
ncbi:hypothetical protein JYU34_020532 [Plutella xylostella]|uniref:Structural maintenance of chromosomes protein 5 n=1 Tax=Plutella xylostella TaxID=51655 RepID=A0ABQ7PUL9_PLUXY|nr:hypothetical protein JYU34_020532 [Plutella xylostella]